MPKDELIKTYTEECKKKLAECNKYHELFSAIQGISREFEKRRFTLDNVHNFKQLDEVKNIVQQLKSTFADELK